MVAQSRDVITNPSVSTFERYERRGSIGNAGVYVGVAAVVAGVLGFVAALLPWVPGNPFGALIGGALSAVAGFFVFTGMVFLLGKNIAGGSGSWDEVAYTFSLFIAPLTIGSAVISFVVSLLGSIPLLGALIGLAGLLVSLGFLLGWAYFAYLAVQSSMNIHDQGKAIITLVLSVIGSFVVQAILGSIFFFL
jgi:hypothetical protein